MSALRGMTAVICLVLTVFLSNLPAFAVNADEMLKDPVLESRARSLSLELRCLVCQNQSIDDSDATLAKDLRTIVRERLLVGDSDRQIMDYVVARYGDFVLLRPPLGPGTFMLWGLPFFALFGGLAFLALRARNRLDQPVVAPLTDVERSAVQDRIAREHDATTAL